MMPTATNPSLYPQFAPLGPAAAALSVGRYFPAILPAYDNLSRAEGYRPAQFIVPGPGNETMTAQGIHTAQLSLLPESYVVGFSGYSSEAAGFEVQIIDLRDGSKFFNQPQSWVNLCPQGSTNGISFPVQYMLRPRIVVEPGMLSVQLRNLAAASNTVQLVVWCIVREEGYSA